MMVNDTKTAKCTVAECMDLHTPGNSLCIVHWHEWNNSGQLYNEWLAAKNKTAKCAVVGCPNPRCLTHPLCGECLDEFIIAWRGGARYSVWLAAKNSPAERALAVAEAAAGIPTIGS